MSGYSGGCPGRPHTALPACRRAGSPRHGGMALRRSAAGFGLGMAVLLGLVGCVSVDTNLRCTTEEMYTSKYHRNGEKTIGVALSGGGTRSASFCIGVMKGLQEAGILGNVDMISSVSGGSYASYWYFSQHYWQWKAPESDQPQAYDLFLMESQAQDKDGERTSLSDPQGCRFQRTVAHSSRIPDYKHKPGLANTLFWNPLVTITNVLGHVISVPLHWAANGVLDEELPLSAARSAYQHGLERAYGLSPLDPNVDNFANGRRFLLFKDVRSQPLTLRQMRSYLETERQAEHRVPFFIFNTTAEPGTLPGVSRLARFCSGPAKRQGAKPPSTKGERELLARDRVYEFTPWRYGSSRFGFAPSDALKSMTMASIVAASGAAVDGQQEVVEITGEGKGPDGLRAFLLDVFNLDLGHHLSNPSVPVGWKIPQNCLPWPLYWIYDYAFECSTKQPLSMNLSDGGHSENLGVYSLVRRDVERIIIVDAELDPGSEFGSAQRLRRQLQLEWEEKERGTEAATGAVRWDKWPFELTQPDGPINVYNTPIANSVIRGVIRTSPNDVGIEVWYIKLSIDRSLLRDDSEPVFDKATGKLHRYPDTVQRYARPDRAFPHNKTADIFYDADQFRAYRDLGYCIVKANMDKLEALKPKSP